ncbi:hypothetical protein [Anaplasma phagocytophilum]|uniref:Uncharacterized protein n=1 Tax=Anaplasma phagocytophilum str. CRT38 TaxID=1269275 RepID=S6GB41_ANAPH|nr:hypothetical protein [Anaplasma phagocytophilum]EOA62296.1 hypothetical protein CRT38_03482 [Anaplasma phagocytophilum str. CRT38]
MLVPEYSHIEDPLRNASIGSVSFLEAVLSEIIENGISSKKVSDAFVFSLIYARNAVSITPHCRPLGSQSVAHAAYILNCIMENNMKADQTFSQWFSYTNDNLTRVLEHLSTSLEHPNIKQNVVCTEERYEAMKTCIFPVITAMMITYHSSMPQIPKQSFKELLEKDNIINKKYSTLKRIIFNTISALIQEAPNYKSKTREDYNSGISCITEIIDRMSLLLNSRTPLSDRNRISMCLHSAVSTLIASVTYNAVHHVEYYQTSQVLDIALIALREELYNFSNVCNLKLDDKGAIHPYSHILTKLLSSTLELSTLASNISIRNDIAYCQKTMLDLYMHYLNRPKITYILSKNSAARIEFGTPSVYGEFVSRINSTIAILQRTEALKVSAESSSRILQYACKDFTHIQQKLTKSMNDPQVLLGTENDVLISTEEPMFELPQSTHITSLTSMAHGTGYHIN